MKLIVKQIFFSCFSDFYFWAAGIINFKNDFLWNFLRSFHWFSNEAMFCGFDEKKYGFLEVKIKNSLQLTLMFHQKKYFFFFATINFFFLLFNGLEHENILMLLMIFYENLKNFMLLFCGSNGITDDWVNFFNCGNFSGGFTLHYNWLDRVWKG